MEKEQGLHVYYDMSIVFFCFLIALNWALLLEGEFHLI